MPYRNQRQFIIASHDYPDKKRDPYLTIKTSVLTSALNNLNSVAFKLWLYLYSHPDKTSLYSIYSHTNTVFPMSASQYKLAVQELINNFYLIPIAPNQYQFYASAQIPTIDSIKHILTTTPTLSDLQAMWPRIGEILEVKVYYSCNKEDKNFLLNAIAEAVVKQVGGEEE